VEKSTHKVEVVRVKELITHPNANSLSIVRVFGFSVCVRTADWNVGDMAAYIQPDSLVPTDRGEFSFLSDKNPYKVRAKKLRGVVSHGLLIPAPEGSTEGDDVAEQLGVTHYEPLTAIIMGTDNSKAPEGYHPNYDIDNWRRYSHLFEIGEEVIATEKIHGTHARYCCVNDEMFVGSHYNWKKEDPETLWWKVLEENPSIRTFCVHNPELTLYGEVFGSVQKLQYGIGGGVAFLAFDILRDEDWVPFDETQELSDEWEIPWVPIIYRGPYTTDIDKHAEGASLIPTARHLREGIVVKPIKERTSLEIGRVILKIVSNDYLSKDY